MNKKGIAFVLILFLGLTLGYFAFKMLRKSEQLPETRGYNYKGEPGRGFFRLADELGLDQKQKDGFRELESTYRVSLSNIYHEIDVVNNQIINELGSNHPDTVILFSLSEKIGGLHEQIKRRTISHFMDLRAICSQEQAIKLSGILEQIGPGKGNRRGEGRGQGRKWRQQGNQ